MRRYLDGHQGSSTNADDQGGANFLGKVPDASSSFFEWANPSLLVSGECSPELHLPHLALPQASRGICIPMHIGEAVRELTWSVRLR